MLGRLSIELPEGTRAFSRAVARSLPLLRGNRRIRYFLQSQNSLPRLQGVIVRRSSTCMAPGAARACQARSASWRSAHIPPRGHRIAPPIVDESILPSPERKTIAPARSKINPDDVDLTLRAFRKSNLANNVIVVHDGVVHDGVEALDCLFATGEHGGRNPDALPQVVLLDLKLPRLDGLQVLERVRTHRKTKLLPVVILTSVDRGSRSREGVHPRREQLCSEASRLSAVRRGRASARSVLAPLESAAATARSRRPIK